MIGDFSYYTGMTFEGYALDLGSPVCSGGRYDNLLQQFGRPAPATGFALKTTRILDVVADEEEEANPVTELQYTAETRAEVLQEARRLREAGQRVVTSVVKEDASCEKR
jgi:ATP phosphoribosyltransferase regulatory subunit